MTNDEQKTIDELKTNDELKNEESQKVETELSDDNLDEVAGGAYFAKFSTMEHIR